MRVVPCLFAVVDSLTLPDDLIGAALAPSNVTERISGLVADASAQSRVRTSRGPLRSHTFQVPTRTRPIPNRENPEARHASMIAQISKHEVGRLEVSGRYAKQLATTRSLWRTCLAAIVIVVLAVPLIAVLAYITIGRTLIGRKLKSLLEEHDTAYIGVDLTVESMRVQLFAGVVDLYGLTVCNPTGFHSEYLLRAEHVTIDIEMWELLTSLFHKINLERIHLTGVCANLERKSLFSSTTNFSVVRDFIHGPDELVLLPKVLVCKEGADLDFDGPGDAITRAWYGAGGHEWTNVRGRDVTDEVKALLAQGKKVSANNGTFGDQAGWAGFNTLLVRVAYELKPVAEIGQEAPTLFCCDEGESISIYGDISTITRAWYGDSDSDQHWSSSRGKDVTNQVKELLRRESEVMASNELMGDPLPGTNKVLLVRAGMDQDLVTDEMMFREDSPVVFNCDEDFITGAWYGDAADPWSEAHGKDVVVKLRELICESRVKGKDKFTASKCHFGDTAPGRTKVLMVRVGDPGRKYTLGDIRLHDVSVNLIGAVVKMVVAIEDTNINLASGSVSVRSVVKLIVKTLVKTLLANVSHVRNG
eukprot:CAMPEP_0117515650 /NCGR_PEP_ID=MMETSP0784-20121206/30689_1 /TAXON_ID=39447 /ORGANISM="" /LENGTH=588 /DNA_ID=CAMNT_0005311473 /DNA_START=58 /DNA_END=1824 /DNA_ORIENTATION=-